MHYEVKLYFLRRQPFYAALVYGKESVVARVARPASDPALFAYFAPLLRESRRVLDAPPPSRRAAQALLLNQRSHLAPMHRCSLPTGLSTQRS